MLNEIICAGFGGQGVLTAGKIIMYVAYKAEKKITWFPSYGNEMRGGSANCNVVVSDEKIANPCVKNPDILLGMNSVSVDKYESLMKKNALDKKGFCAGRWWHMPFIPALGRQRQADF